MPEEFFFLLLELGMGIYFGIIPATLNRLVHCSTLGKGPTKLKM